MGMAEDAASGGVKAVITSIGDLFHKSKRKKRLTDMLQDQRFEFGRTITQLAAAIGADDATARRLLLEINARPSETNPDLWTLKPPPVRKKSQ